VVHSPFSGRWEHALGAPVISVAATPAFSLVLAGCLDRHAYAFDRCGRVLWSRKFDHEVWAVGCTHDGDCIAVGTAEKRPSKGAIYILTPAGETLLAHSVEAPVWSISFSPDGSFLVAGTWGGDCCLFRRESGLWSFVRSVRLGSCGVYGVTFTGTQHQFAAVDYARGIRFVSLNGTIEREIPQLLAGYNIAHAATSHQIFVAARSGQVLRTSTDNVPVSSIHIPNAGRAICAVATVHDSAVVYTGGFDGYTRAVSPSGELFWELDCVGEVWSITCSPSGDKIAIGAGDGRIRVLDGALTTDTLSELEAHVASLGVADLAGDAERKYHDALDFFISVGLFSYTVRLLQSQRESKKLAPVLYNILIQKIFDACPDDQPDKAHLALELGNILKQRPDHWLAATYYLKASRHPSLRLKAFTEAANEFLDAGHPAAALACFRRAREPVLTSDDLRLIYVLARSFEDIGQTKIARDHLDTIMVQEPEYRDVAVRLQRIVRGGQLKNGRVREDYTGLAVNLLGPDVPSLDVDPKLASVVKARSAELNVTSTERDEYNAVIKDLYEKKILMADPSIRSVAYDTKAYIKYDDLLPEDDVKKKLEAINLVALTRKVSNPSSSLDIGTATGRYPGLFMNLGYEAFGIDSEETAIEYSKSKFPGSQCPHFSVGDVRSIPFPIDRFDVVTCMMGTFFHIAKDEHTAALSEMVRVCSPRGLVAISTWDLECPHLTFLSMYSVKEKELIARNSRTGTELVKLLEQVGLENNGIVRLGMIPDTISYDLGIENLDIDGVERLLEIDIAARTTVPSKHGQMFIAYGFKPAST
jgi:ubiquinone/menaquinone biosynthesis C-methylase UbiE